MSSAGKFSDVVGSTGYISAGVMRRMANIILVTEGLDRGTAEYLGYHYAPSMEEGIKLAKEMEKGEESIFGVLTHGADLAPKIIE